ncbi:MAG TPA: sigma-70 family RNA polymerase sigma factor [Fimbriimonadaceae bacterium]|nr:sigma-70 family RNA polymerase sigma factor [Fimbriimonadaceae bacterium]
MCTAVAEFHPFETEEQERRAFEKLMGETESRAYSMALQLTRNKFDAEDLMQDTIVKAWRRFDSYLPGRPFLNWLLRIMQRTYLDTLRRSNPIRKAESLNSMISPSDGEVQEIQIEDPAPSAEAETQHKELQEGIRQAMDKLPDLYRTAIELCDFDQLSYSEIADKQNTTIGTIRSRIHRGRKMLRDIILRDYPQLVEED